MSPDDRASIDEEFYWSLRNKARTVVTKEFLPGEIGYGPLHCRNEDCEEVLPEARRRAGCQLCTDCQGLAERREKRGY